MARYRQPYSLLKRGKYYYYRTYDARGIRTVAKSTGCTSKSSARAYCDKLYLEGKLTASNVTFKQYAMHFFDDDSVYIRDRVTPLSDNTLRNYRIRLEQSIMPFFADYKMADINYTLLKEYRIYLMNRYKASVVTSAMSCLKHIIDYAYRDQIITINPYAYLEPLALPVAERDAFTLEEVKIVYDNINPEFQKTILLMALTGMRISEAVGLTPDDIKQNGDLIYIDLYRQFNHKQYIPLKNKEVRQIPIIPEIKTLIGFDNMRLPAFYRYYSQIKPLIKDADIRGLSFHSLRHFFITNAKSYGIAEIKVEYIAGHSLKGISKVYTNFKAGDVKEITQWQEQILHYILPQ